jgi:hypothetical protein
VSRHDDDDDEAELARATELGPGVHHEYWGPDPDACMVFCRRFDAVHHRYRRHWCPRCHGRARAWDFYAAVERPDDDALVQLVVVECDLKTVMGRVAGHVMRGGRDAIEVLRTHKNAPLFSLKWRVPEYVPVYLECPVCRANQGVGNAIR